MFGPNFLKNTALVFTRWTQSKKEVLIRKKNNNTDEEKARSFNKYIKELLHFDTDTNPLKCFFIDNSLNTTDEEVIETFEDIEFAQFDKTLEKIQEFALEQPAFLCKDM